jgi:hypothetical protein
MADTKLSALTALAVEMADVDEIYLNDGGVSKRQTYAVFKAAFATAAQGTTADSALQEDGSTPLTANWDVGAFTITGTRFISDIATGTAPLAVSSTTVVPNLNVDQVDGKDSTDLVLVDGTQALTADWDAGSFKITAETLESDVTTGTAPLVIASTTAVNNLNADQVDGKDATDFLLLDGTQTMTGDLVFTEAADHSSTPGAGFGYLWTKNTTPSTLIFTDDSGADTTLGAGGGGGAFSADGDTQITPTTPIVLDHASNDEIALDLSYTVNKAGGSDTGLKVDMTDTASPSSSFVAWFGKGGTPIQTIRDYGQIAMDCGANVASVEIRNTGSGNTNGRALKCAGSIAADYILGVTYNGTNNRTSGSYTGLKVFPTYNQASGTAANTDVLVNRTETAVGSGEQNLIDLQVGGTSKVRVDNTGTIIPDKTTADEAFIDFNATIDADATSAISSLTTSGGVTHHIQISLNGTTAWIPCSTTDPT